MLENRSKQQAKCILVVYMDIFRICSLDIATFLDNQDHRVQKEKSNNASAGV